MPTQQPVLPFIASDLPRMRAWQPTHAGSAAGPSYRSVLLSEETVGSTHLTHGLEVAFGPRRHRRHPDRPGQRPYSSSTLARRHEDTRRHFGGVRFPHPVNWRSLGPETMYANLGLGDP